MEDDVEQDNVESMTAIVVEKTLTNLLAATSNVLGDEQSMLIV